jgi:hypothetical protein
MAHKVKAPKVKAPAAQTETKTPAPVTDDADLENDILNLTDGEENDDYKFDDEKQEEQKILKLNDLINDAKKDIEGSALVEIYFFSDKILKFENFLSGQNTVYMQPIFIKVSNKERKGLKAIGLTKLKEIYGENYGVVFSENKSRMIHTENCVNVLRVDVRQMKKYKEFSYYSMQNFAGSIKDKAVDLIKSKHYEDAKTFIKITKKTAAAASDDEDSEDKLLREACN